MFYFTNYFEDEYKGRQIKSLRNLLNKAEDLTKKYSSETEISDIEISDIEHFTQIGEKIGLLCRASLEEREKMEFDYYSDSYAPLCIENLPVSFSFDGKAATLSTPFLLTKASLKIVPGHYQLADYLKAAATDWERKNPGITLWGNAAFQGAAAVIITRKAHSYNRLLHCDNDNLEVGRLLNSLCSILGIGDNCTKLDYISRFRKCPQDETPGTEIIITGLNNLSDYL